MQPLRTLGSLGSPVSEALTQKSDRDANLREAWRRELFLPYAASLGEWYGKIQNVVQGNSDEEQKHSDFRLAYSLFAIAVDPALTESDKKARINAAQKALEEGERKELHFYFANTFPPVISTHVLRYYDAASWQQVHYSRANYCRYAGNEPHFFNWIKEVAQSTWELAQKSAFYDALLDSLSDEEGKELLYYFELHADKDTKKCFMGSRSFALAEKMCMLAEQSQKIATTITKQTFPDEVMKIDLPRPCNERRCLLQWFLHNCIACENAPLVVADFEDEDWNWLQQQKIGIPLTPLVQSWMASMLCRLNRQKEASKESPGMWLFLNRAAKCINNQKGSDVQGDYSVHASAFTAHTLHHYLGAIKGEIADRVVAHIAKNEPSKLLEWLHVIMNPSLTANFCM